MTGADVPAAAREAHPQAAIDAVAELFREKMPGVNCEAWARAVLEAAAPHLEAAERSRLFVAIRHAIPLDKPWRGEALDLIAAVWRKQP